MNSINGTSLNIGIGNYPPRLAGVAAPSPSGGIAVDGQRFAVPEPVTMPSDVDLYIQSIPNFEYTPPAPQETFAFPPETEDEPVAAQEDQTATDNAETADTDTETAGNELGAAEYTPEEQRIIDDLQARDREVRAHEQAHITAGGAYVRGGATYQYEQAPDGRRYAVGGEVNIDSSPVRGDPEATIAKMQAVRAAAMAPVEPSAQDRAVAASAARAEAEAAAELRELRAAEAQPQDNANGANADNDNGNAAQQPSRIQSNAANAYAAAANFADASQPTLSNLGNLVA